MKLIDGWATPEGKMAKRFTVVCAIFFAVMFLLTFFLKNCGGWSEGWPVGVWHALDVGIIYVAIGLVALDVFILLIYPLWRWERGGQESGKRAYEIAVTTSGYVLGAMLVTLFFTFSTFCEILDHDESGQVQHFENYYDIGSNEFRAFMVPRSAKDIKVYVDHSIGSRTCDISCTVGMEGLLEFAKENGYRFERREHMLGFADSCITRELEIDTANITNYLFSSIGLEENASGGSAKSGFGNALFAYDIANKRLVGSYWD